MELAQERIIIWKEEENRWLDQATLDLSELGLTELPELPSTVTRLDCRGNFLTFLPSPLPSQLTWLDCSENPLVSLPADLPSCLEHLNCCNTDITTIPSTLPSNLKYLHIDSNKITYIPSLPSKLRYLACEKNQLITLPALPASLICLSCQHNKLVTLPDLPLNFKWLTCHSNDFPIDRNDNTNYKLYWDIEHPHEFLKQLRIAEEELQRYRTQFRTGTIKEELMMEIWSPARIQKRLDAGEDLETIMT